MPEQKEFCDLYDENRRPLGKVHCRGDELAAGEFLLAAGVWILNSRNEILLTKRHESKRPAPNLWEYTGGYAKAGETGQAAAMRELFEETGIRAVADELCYLGSSRIPPFIEDDFYIRRDISASEIILCEGETSGAKWVSYAEFLGMADTGELAPYVMDFFAPVRVALEAVLK